MLSFKSLTLLIFLHDPDIIFSYIPRNKRETDTVLGCEVEYYLQECDANTVKLFAPISRTTSNTFSVHLQSLCVFSKIEYEWHLHFGKEKIESDNFKDRSSVTLAPFEIDKSGQYSLEILISLHKDEDKESLPIACEFEVLPEPPTAVITGGNERIVSSGESFILDGSNSIDNNFPPNAPGQLQFQWTCVVTTGAVKDFCDGKTYSVGKLTVPADMSLENYIYLFTLQVKADNKNSQATQTVTILKTVIELEIFCEKNCLPTAPVTNSKSVTILRANCLKNCHKLNNDSYLWTVDVTNFDYNQNVENGRNSVKFVIKSNVLSAGVDYKIKLELQGGLSGGGSKIIKPHVAPTITSCDINPASGKALETTFKATCEYTGDITSFEILTSETLVVAKSSSLLNLYFCLPANVNVTVKIVDKFDFYSTLKVKVQVDNLIPVATNPDTFKHKVSQLFDSVSNSIETKQFEVASQIMNVVLEEVKLKKNDLPDLLVQVKKNIIDKMSQFPMDNKEQALSVAAMITKVVQTTLGKSDPVIAKIASELCKKAAHIILEEVKTKFYPKTESDFTEQSSKSQILMACCEQDAQENFDAIKPVPIINITTPFPLLTVQELLPEDYQDYVDEDTLSKTRSYQEASENFVGICEDSLESMTLSAGEGESSQSSTDLCRVSVIKDLGSEIVKRRIKNDGIKIDLSEDFHRVTQAVNLMLCLWTRDPFWWNPKKQKTFSNVMFLNLEQSESGEDYKKFKEPLTLAFDVTNKFEIESLRVEFPSTSYSTDEDVSIVKITVRGNEAFFVKFDLTDDNSFQVLITEMRKPKLYEIDSKGVMVSKNNSLLYREHDKDYNSWYYVSVFPSIKPVAVKLSYSISVYSLSCYSWVAHKKSWEFACKGTAESGEKLIVCQCYHLSILAGMAYNNEIKIEIPLDTDFLTILLRCPIIFFCVCASVAGYCLLISLVPLRRKSNIKKLYFLCDNIRTSRYTYLIMVKTGNWPSSGTSSNVCIKIFGDKSESKSHVLNYPDPEMRLLQWGNSDWFVMTTDRFLGDITKVVMWSDYSGRKPAWYCHHVVIYDLQEKREWRFPVKAWIDLPPEEKILIRVDLSEGKKLFRGGRWKRILAKLRMQRTAGEVSYFKKVTLFLSVTVTIFVYAFAIYGLPKLRMMDAFSSNFEFDFYDSKIPLISLASCAISFVQHTILLTVFKNSESDLDRDEDFKKSFSGKVTISCWIFLAFNIAACIAVLLVFGFWMTEITVWLWFTSSASAVIVYFLIFENIYERVLNLKRTTGAQMSLIWGKLESITSSIESHRKQLLMTFGEFVLRPFLTQLYRKLDEDEIEERRLQQEYRMKVVTLIEDIIMFAFYILLLFLTIYANKDRLAVNNRAEILSLINGEHNSRSMTLEDIVTITDIYDYINGTLIIAMQSATWYSKYVVKEPGMTADFNNKYLGVARIRIKKSRETPCKVPRSLRKFYRNSTCAPEYFKSKHDTRNRGPAGSAQHRLSSVWNYTAPDQSGYSIVIGKFGAYYGGGYVAPLGRTLYNSYVTLDYLRDFEWLDLKTRAVFVEFLTYNVNTNLFTAARIIFEISASGFIRIVPEIETTKLLFVNHERRLVQAVIYLGFLVVVSLFTVKILIRMCRLRKKFFLNAWLLIDLFIICLSYGCFVLFMHRMSHVKNFLLEIEGHRRNEFIHYFTLFHEDLVITILAALLIFVSTVRLWKLIRFGKNFKILEKTVLLSAKPIFALFICHVCIILAFSFSGSLFFSTFSQDFKDLPDSITTVILLSLGVGQDFDLEILTDQKPIWGRIYHIIYSLSSLLITNLYVAVITISYANACLFYSETDSDNPVRLLLSQEFLYFKTVFGIKLRRLRGGDDVKLGVHVTPKTDEYRYAKSLTVSSNTMLTMSCVAQYHLQKFSMEDDKKISLMSEIYVQLNMKDGDNREIFFAQKDGKSQVRIIPDGRFHEMEYVAEKILRGGRSKRREKARGLYKKQVTGQLARIKYFEEVLKSAVNVLSNIEIH